MNSPQRIGMKFWRSIAASAVFRADAAEETSLHRQLGKLIKRYRPQRLLDYGCGDGVLLKFIPSNVDVTVFDISENALRLAEQNARREIRICRNAKTLKAASFDLIVFSLVLICIPDFAGYRRVLRACHRILRSNGRMLIAVTHPCFRGEAFASHQANYHKAPFRYLDALHQFPVTLYADGRSPFTFKDYHWLLSDTVNLATEQGFVVTALHELPDVATARRPANERVPPFLVLTLSKSRS